MPSILILILFFPLTVLIAKELGTYGHTFPIKEENPIEYLKKRLQLTEPQLFSQKLRQIQSHYKQSLLTPKPVMGLKEATSSYTHYFDPTITTKKEIKDHQGNIILQKGASYNPLQHLALSEDLLFFDGNNPTHVEWAKSLGNQTKWILINGLPLDLEEQENRHVYFDQFGLLTNKLKMVAIPAHVSQEGIKLKIETISLQEPLCE